MIHSPSTLFPEYTSIALAFSFNWKVSTKTALLQDNRLDFCTSVMSTTYYHQFTATQNKKAQIFIFFVQLEMYGVCCIYTYHNIFKLSPCYPTSFIQVGRLLPFHLFILLSAPQTKYSFLSNSLIY